MKEQVEVGDWSRDGHNMSDKYIIEVPEGIDSTGAYALACRELGFSMDQYCRAYEDSKFPAENLEKIIGAAKQYNVPLVFDEYSELGYAIEEGDMSESSDEAGAYVYLCADDFFALWLAMLNIGIVVTRGPNATGLLAHEVKPTKQDKVHHIGGYGLYFH